MYFKFPDILQSDLPIPDHLPNITTEIEHSGINGNVTSLIGCEFDVTGSI